MKKRRDKLEEGEIVLEILNRIPVTTKLVSAQEIRDSLANSGIEISQRTLQRYLKRMTESEKFGLVRDTRERTFGYRRIREESVIQSIALKPNECLLLRLAQEHLKFQMPGVVLKSLNFLFSEAERKLNEQSRNLKEKNWLKKVAVVSSTLPQLPAKIPARIFDEVSEALFRDRKLRVSYENMKGYHSGGTVNPLGLVQQDGRLYLVCNFENYENIVHLALHRLKKVELTDFESERPKDFDLNQYIHSRHFNYSNGQKILWILEFTNEITARNMMETPFDTEQVLKKVDDNRWRLELKIQNSNLLDGWIATYGKGAGIVREERIPLPED